MLRRKALSRFEFWKKNKTKQALLVTGARQVGKTFLVRFFVEENYKSFVEFNLVENIALRNSLKVATSAEDLMLRISAASKSIMQPGNTLVFIDEIQECPEIVTFIKFLVDKNEYDFILSGSLLGVELESIRSQPVGYITEVMMYPLDFEEFCWAGGLSEELMQMAKAGFNDIEPLPEFLHDRLTSLFRIYLLVGGMPDAVTVFFRTNSLDQVRIAQNDITAYYARDISKYAPVDRRLVIKNIYDLIPSELSCQNRRFKLSSIENVKRFTQVHEEFLWLIKANVAFAAYNVKAPISPLLLSEDHRLFKLFQSDVGLLTSSFPKELSIGILDGLPAKQMGGVYENFVAQELSAHGFSLHYYTRRNIGEIDFVIEKKDGTIIAIEVKSGAAYKTHAALSNALAVKEYDISEAMVFAETNVERVGHVTYFPIYLVSMLDNN